MPYDRFSDAETAFKFQPGQDWFRQLRDNQDYFDAKIQALFAKRSHASLYDDFMSPAPGSAPDTAFWEVAAGGTHAIAEEHVLSCSAAFGGSGDYMGAALLATAMRPQIDYELIYTCEFRLKHSTFGNLHQWFAGMQDASFAINNGNIKDTGDMIGFIRGSGDTSKWRFRISSGGAGVETDGLGSASVWTTFKITVTCSATPGLREVVAEVDGYPVAGSPFTANIPTMKLRPYFGVAQSAGGAAGPVFLNDFLLYGPDSRPLNA